MTSGSGQHYYMAKRGNGTDTYSKSHKSPKGSGQNFYNNQIIKKFDPSKVEKLYSHRDKTEEKRRSERPDRIRKSSKVRRSRERDSFRQMNWVELVLKFLIVNPRLTSAKTHWILKNNEKLLGKVTTEWR